MVGQFSAASVILCSSHTEINDKLARKICEDLGIPFMK